jgi:hypothetical protein
MAQSGINLASIFQTVTQTLAENKQSLNQADTYNQDHGNNMVQTFQTITNALMEKQNSKDSTALAYAAKQVAQNSSSSSGQLYSQGLAEAAKQFQGKQIDAQGAMQLLQMLISGGQTQQTQASQPAGGDILGTILGGLTGGGQDQGAQPQSAGGDILGALLGGLAGGGQAQDAQPQSAGGDILGALLGGLTGGEQPQQQAGSGNASGGSNSGLDMGDLLNAGMAFMQSKQQGGSTTQALVQAFIAGSGMGNSVHRSQSTQLVVSSFLQALGSLNKQQ